MAHTEEDKNRISLQMKEKWKDPVYRQHQIDVHKLVVVPEERKIRTSQSVKKLWATEEGREKLLKNRKGSPNKGKHASEETRQKQRIARLGKYSGEKCPSWRGGISFEPYCVKFNNEFKERVRAFFGYRCQMCGHTWHEGERRLAVHHVNFRKDSCCAPDVIPLFVPLCQGKCHSKTNFNRAFWEDWFTEIINEFYGGKCYFTKEEMENRELNGSEEMPNESITDCRECRSWLADMRGYPGNTGEYGLCLKSEMQHSCYPLTPCQAGTRKDVKK